MQYGLGISARGLVHQREVAHLQHAANLSPGWRPDCSIPALVCAGPRPQLDGGRDYGLRRRGRTPRPRRLDSFGVVCDSLCVHLDELLERATICAGIVASGKVATPRWIRLPVV
jgi:hypothetical protein